MKINWTMSWNLLDKLVKNPMFAENTHCFIQRIGEDLKSKMKRGDLFSVNDKIEVICDYPYCWDAIKLTEKVYTTDSIECYMAFFARDEELKKYKYQFCFRLRTKK